MKDLQAEIMVGNRSAKVHVTSTSLDETRKHRKNVILISIGSLILLTLVGILIAQTSQHNNEVEEEEPVVPPLPSVHRLKTFKNQQMKIPFEKRHYVGITNEGNTCYANSLIQQLYHCMPFKKSLKTYVNGTCRVDTDSADASEACKMAVALNSVFETLDKTAQSSHVTESNFSIRPALPEQFRDSAEQQDASELFNIYVLMLELDWSPFKMAVKSVVKYYDEAGKNMPLLDRDIKDETFSLQLALPKALIKSKSKKKGNEEEKKDLTMSQVIEFEFNRSAFELDDDHTGKGCKSAIQQKRIVSMPEVLVVQLMRSVKGGQKIDKKISTERLIDLSDYMHQDADKKQKSCFLLSGFVHHRGDDPNSGHYVSYVDDKLLNDDSISTASVDAGKNIENVNDGYIYFYSAVDNENCKADL